MTHKVALEPLDIAVLRFDELSPSLPAGAGGGGRHQESDLVRNKAFRI